MFFFIQQDSEVASCSSKENSSLPTTPVGTSSKVPSIDHSQIDYQVRYFVNKYFVMFLHKSCDFEKNPFPIPSEILHLPMTLGAYDAVRMKCKDSEYRVLHKLPILVRNKLMNSKNYKEIHMFRGHKTEYVRTPWMRIQYHNKFTIIPSKTSGLIVGPYCNDWKCDPFEGEIIELHLGEIIMEGGLAYNIGGPYSVVRRKKEEKKGKEKKRHD